MKRRPPNYNQINWSRRSHRSITDIMHAAMLCSVLTVVKTAQYIAFESFKVYKNDI